MKATRAQSVQLPPTEGAAIAPLEVDVARPLISVMLPVYEPNEYLLDALRSVLMQDIGPADMQIAIVDDASVCDTEALVGQVAPPGRIEFYRSAVNQGLAGNWNQSIRIARGHIVHILHQDDWIADGFYRRLLPAFNDRPQVGMAFSRHAIAESKDRIVRFSHRERWRAGVLKHWLEKITERQRIQCASVLVRRSVYEQLGGYREDLCYALDWEMWVRIAARFEVWYEPRKLAYYRRHVESETNRIISEGKAGLDVLNAVEAFTGHLPELQRATLAHAAYKRFIQQAIKQLNKSKTRDAEFETRLKTVRAAMARLPAKSIVANRFSKELAKFELPAERS